MKDIRIHAQMAMGGKPMVKKGVTELAPIRGGGKKIVNHEKGAPAFEKASGGGWKRTAKHAGPKTS